MLRPNQMSKPTSWNCLNEKRLWNNNEYFIQINTNLTGSKTRENPGSQAKQKSKGGTWIQLHPRLTKKGTWQCGWLNDPRESRKASEMSGGGPHCLKEKLRNGDKNFPCNRRETNLNIRKVKTRNGQNFPPSCWQKKKQQNETLAGKYFFIKKLLCSQFLQRLENRKQVQKEP